MGVHVGCVGGRERPDGLPSASSISKEGGQKKVTVALPGSYATGDGLQLQYTSVPVPSFKKAQEAAVLDIWELLLVNRPAGVLIHPNSVSCPVQQIREAAEALQHAVLAVVPAARQTAQQIGHDFAAGARQKAEPTSRRVQYDPDHATEEETMEFLCRELPAGHRQDPSRLPGRIWQTLGHALPPGQLKATIARHPDMFEVHDAGNGAWAFSVRPRAGDVAAPRPAAVAAPPGARLVMHDDAAAVAEPPDTAAQGDGGDSAVAGPPGASDDTAAPTAEGDELDTAVGAGASSAMDAAAPTWEQGDLGALQDDRRLTELPRPRAGVFAAPAAGWQPASQSVADSVQSDATTAATLQFRAVAPLSEASAATARQTWY